MTPLQKLKEEKYARPNGKSFQQMQMLYEVIKKAKKYIVYNSMQGKVHILPDNKLQEIKDQAHKQGREEVKEV